MSDRSWTITVSSDRQTPADYGFNLLTRQPASSQVAGNVSKVAIAQWLHAGLLDRDVKRTIQSGPGHDASAQLTVRQYGALRNRIVAAVDDVGETAE
jgi:hypothetical protein